MTWLPQVVGRVTAGKELLDTFNDIATLPNDSPINGIRITRCGATTSKGTHDSLADATAAESKEQATARLQQESLDTKNAIMWVKLMCGWCLLQGHTLLGCLIGVPRIPIKYKKPAGHCIVVAHPVLHRVANDALLHCWALPCMQCFA